MNESEIRTRIILLAFQGNEHRLIAFRKKLQAGLPAGTGIALRGSVVTNSRWEDGSPFDALGTGTSDLDVTLVGKQVMEYWRIDAYYIPGLHTKPLSDQTPDVAPGLNDLRTSMQKFVRRPVNFQATASLVLFARDVLFGEPYFTLVEASEGS